jgi:hypothetical protein
VDAFLRIEVDHKELALPLRAVRHQVGDGRGGFTDALCFWLATT